MAITNQERVGKALELLRQGLAPFVEREFVSTHKDKALAEARRLLSTDDRLSANRTINQWDAGVLLKVLWDAWNDIFGRALGRAERSLVQELRDCRNKWAHQEPFSSDDADRALDSIARLLTAISAPQADEVGRMKMELRRVIYDEQVRGEKRKAGGSLIEGAASGVLPAWRDVVTPHKDVASGRYQQAEFAADLWQVHLGEGSDEYKNPAEFFRRTYLTQSLERLLVGAVQRLSGGGGDPVVQLQTNFGGGKTHSMLALYHLFSGARPSEMAGVDAVLADAGVNSLPKAKRVVLVGNKISPGSPVTKADGTVVRTLWGELAWQLGNQAGGIKEASKAYKRVTEADKTATNPGDVLRELFNEYGPCLILIDEWVAYARQLHDEGDLPAGSFETQFTFAQALTESAKAAKNCLLVISLPASDTATSSHAVADDVEVGGERGRSALARLRNVVGRVESSWTPATAEEGFEIVRRRLFEPLAGPELFKQRDVTARAFADLYRTQAVEFPRECRDADYEKRIQAAFPIHPEIFDRLYTDWSTLVKFQRTRGVLRLMASVIHSLWEKGDRNPLILPSTIPLDDPRVRDELTRYLSDNWKPIIEKDVDGPNSLPLKIDSEVPNLGKLHATRRVARTIYLGSAPTARAAHRGIEDLRVTLGCVMPGESAAVFGDALRRLAATATYLYQDGPRVWYSTQPTVTKLAEDRAELLKRDPDKVGQELDTRLRKDLSKTGEFSRIHPMPQSSQDVPDDLDARLVVLGINYAYAKEPASAGEKEAKAILEARGSTPRLYRNSLVFLAPDRTRLQDLEEAACKFLAWQSIIADNETLNLDPHQLKQAETQKVAADSVVTARLPETYQWLLVPVQTSPKESVKWQAIRLSGQDALAARASKRLRNDELLITSFAPTRLRMELDRVPLWRGQDVAVRQLAEDFAKYVYLPRLADPAVLLHAIRDGVALLTWSQDSFAFADSYDEGMGRYRALRVGQMISIADASAPGLVVKPAVAQAQLDAEKVVPPEQTLPECGTIAQKPILPNGSPAPTTPKPTRFHGSVALDPTRVGRDAGKIADEVIAHLVGLMGSNVKVTLEIEAKISSGVPDHVVHTVTENSRTLKFTQQGFEEE
jgi:predicted AAA+ superfamily ATPase